MKTCYVCKVEKPFVEMCKRKDGVANLCKRCHADRERERNHRPRPEHSPNTERIRAAWPDGQRECLICREMLPLSNYHADKNSHDGVYSICRSCRKPLAKRAYSEKPNEKLLWEAARKRAAQSNLPFDIDVEDVIIPEICPALGIKLTKSGGKSSDNSPSLDRFIPSSGYVKGNIAVISMLANRIKSNADADDLEKVVKWMRKMERA